MRQITLNCFLLLSLCSCAQQNKENDESKHLNEGVVVIINNFFKIMKSGNFNNAIDELLSNNENIDIQDSLALNLKSKFKDVNQSSGKLISYRLLRKKSLANDLGVYSYIVKYDKKAYRFLFTFYNNDTRIKIYKFSFDDTLDIELEESLRLYLNQ